MNTTQPTLLFDLDGTLTDSREGILNSFRFAFRQLGLPVPPDKTLDHFIGPPIRDAMKEHMGMSPDQAEQIITAYREYFVEKGILENRLYPGIGELLTTLQEQGFVLAVATSKPEVYATRILEHFCLNCFFSVICGCELDGRRATKQLVIAETLNRLGQTSHPGARPPVMIGDRRHDMEGGKSHGLSTAGVLWGYGSRDELVKAGADFLAETPEALLAFLTGKEHDR